MTGKVQAISGAGIVSVTGTLAGEIPLPGLRHVMPALALGAIVTRLEPRHEGSLVEVLLPAWEQIQRLLKDDPAALSKLRPEQWEELVAATYDRAGFDEVILTPRSGDLGRDVIATRNGWGSVRIIDQVKAYSFGHPVPANDVRALLGVLSSDPKATKAVMTTTSTFAPRITEDPTIQPFCPYRLELVDGAALMNRLKVLGGV